MEEIDLQELFKFIKEKIGFLIIITVSICLVGCIYGLFIQVPMFKSYTTVILGSTQNTETSITQTDVTLNKNLVDTYAEIVKSKRVLDQVIDALSLGMTYEQLYNKIAVTAVNNTEIIKITVTDQNSIKAKNIANVTANYFTKEVSDLYKMDNVNVLDEATIANNPYNVNIPKQIIIYFMIGFVIGAGILFVIFYFDRTIKTTEQIEQKLKLPILGSVQLNTSKGGKK